jgi:hypothetical protein
VDLDSGTILVGPELKDVAQHVALAFATSLLYLMVQPRFTIYPELPLLNITPSHSGQKCLEKVAHSVAQTIFAKN